MMYKAILIIPGITGTRVLFQNEDFCGTVANVAIGTPPQELPVAVSFVDSSTRLIKTSFPFAKCFDYGASSTFEATEPIIAESGLFGGSFSVARDTIVLGGDIVIPEANIAHMHSISAMDSFYRSVAGRIGLGPRGDIAKGLYMSIRTQSIFNPATRQDRDRSFSIDFSASYEPISYSGIQEQAIPIIPDRDSWTFRGSISILGQTVETDIAIDPSSDSFGISRDYMEAIKGELTKQKVPHEEVGGRLLLPCDSNKFVTINHDAQVESSSGSFTVYAPSISDKIQYHPTYRVNLCYSVYKVSVTERRVWIGHNLLFNRHSVVLDAPNQLIRLNNYYPRIPLHSAIPSITGMPFRGPPAHSGRFEVTEEALVMLPSLPTDSCQYIFTQNAPVNMHGVNGPSFVFSIASGACHTAITASLVPGLFHLTENMAVADAGTGRVLIPWTKASSPDLPVYEVTIHRNSMMLFVAFTKVEVTVDFDQLDIDVAEPNELPEDEDCVVCRAKLAPGDQVSKIVMCKHTIHETCLQEWVKRRLTCPQCTLSIGVKQKANLRKI
jgi:hypothetical protein